jgi:hypothetical protein
MLYQKKEALFNIFICGLSAILYVLFITNLGQYRPLITLVMFTMIIISTFIYRRIIKRKCDDLNPQDIFIRDKASNIAFYIFKIFFVLISIILFSHYKNNGSFSTFNFLFIIFFGWIILYISWSISTLILYNSVKKNRN